MLRRALEQIPHYRPACLVLISVFANGVVAPLCAQHPFTPGVAFGAFVFPYVDGNRSAWAVQFDLFTELSKDLVLDLNGVPLLDPVTGEAQFQRYNNIDRTIGFNQVGYSRVWENQITAKWWLHHVFWGAGGVVWDTPAEFLQNEAAHGLRLLTHVPRDSVVDHVVLGVGTEHMLSRGLVLNPWLDVIFVGGVGVGLSTSYVDGYGQLGGELSITPNRLWGRLGILHRWGLVGDPLPWEGLNLGLGNSYKMWQAWVLLPLDSFFSAWFPRLRVAYTDSRGPFVEAGGGSPHIRERLWSVRFESPVGQWAVEMWNDFAFKDLGPTFGLRIQWYN